MMCNDVMEVSWELVRNVLEMAIDHAVTVAALSANLFQKLSMKPRPQFRRSSTRPVSHIQSANALVQNYG